MKTATPSNNNKNNKVNNSSFLMQGMLLASASIVSRIIGLIYRVPLTAIIGKAGNDNYGTAFSIYNILLIISSYSLPLAISKMIATRMAEGKVRESKKVLDLGFTFALISGGSAFLVVFFGADYFAGNLLKTPNAAFALRILSPALLMVAFLGVFRGFFQGLGTMIPSAISQIIEQIINAFVSIFAAYMLFNAGIKISDEIAASKGAGGGTLGTVSGAGAALLFLLFVFFSYKTRFRRKLRRDRGSNFASNKTLIWILILTIIPVLLSTTLYNISSIIDQGIYKNLALGGGADTKEVSNFWGVYSGQYNVIINIPLAISNSIAASIVPSLASSFKQQDNPAVRGKIAAGMRFVGIVAFPCMIGFLCLGSPIMQLLFDDSDLSSGYMMMLGAVSVLFYSISTFTNGVLQGIDKMHIPVIHAAVSLSLQAGLLVVLMKYSNLSIYSVIIANIFYALLMCILNERSVKKYTKVMYSKKRVYIIPMIASGIMGLFVLLTYFIIFKSTNNNTFATLPAICVGVLVYLVSMIKLRGISEADIKRVPKGYVMIKIFKKVKLL